MWGCKSFLPSEKLKVLNHPPYSPDLSPCDFFLFPRLKKMLSASRSSLGSAIYQCLQQIPKEDYLSAFRDWVKRLQKCVSKGGVLWRFVIKMFDKTSTEVIWTQWQNFLLDPRIHDCLDGNKKKKKKKKKKKSKFFFIENSLTLWYVNTLLWTFIFLSCVYSIIHCTLNCYFT